MKIFKDYAVTNEEFSQIQSQYGNLVHFASWSFLGGNSLNNHTEDIEDLQQALSMSLVKAGMYYKRQSYIIKGFIVLEEYLLNDEKLKRLKRLWDNRRKHGAYKQTFGPTEEDELDKLLEEYIPEEKRPSKKAALVLDDKFTIYLKSIMWNEKKCIGKKTTREISIRKGCVSISEHSNLI